MGSVNNEVKIEDSKLSTLGCRLHKPFSPPLAELFRVFGFFNHTNSIKNDGIDETICCGLNYLRC